VTKNSRVVFWDFDGTPAWRPGGWAGCLLEVLDKYAAEHDGTLEQINCSIRGGFRGTDTATLMLISRPVMLGGTL
jgi:hypothetical protein